MKKIICIGFLSLSMFLFSNPSHAKYSISPSINLEEVYNDNIFLESENEEDDFITTISPKIVFDYSSGKAVSFNLDYELNFRYYDRHSNLNDEDIREIQTIAFKGNIKPSNIFQIDINDTFNRVPINVRRSSSLDNAHENMTDRNVFEIAPFLRLPMTDTITATIGYSYQNTSYKDQISDVSSPSSVDSEAHSGFFTLSKKFSPQIDGAVSYEYYAYRPDATNAGGATEVSKYDRQQASILIDYQFTPDIKINAEIGEAWFEYSNANDKREFYWNIGTENIIKITKNTTLGVDYGIHFNDSATEGAFRSQELNLYFETGQVLKFRVDPYYHNNKHLTSNRENKIVGVTLELSRPLTNRIDVSLDSEWEKAKYLPQGEDTRLYGVGGDFHYRLSKKMEIIMGYRYNRQNASSNISSEELEIRDYDNNIAWLQAKWTF